MEEEDEQELKPLRRGWGLGSEEFRQRMLDLMEGKLGENHSGELRRETAEQKGNRVIAEELARLGWQESDLASHRKAHPDKLAIALRFRNETTLFIKWIAARVRIGSSKGAKSVLHRWVHGQDKTTALQPKACAQLEFESTVCPNGSPLHLWRWPLSPVIVGRSNYGFQALYQAAAAWLLTPSALSPGNDSVRHWSVERQCQHGKERVSLAGGQGQVNAIVGLFEDDLAATKQFPDSLDLLRQGWQ